MFGCLFIIFSSQLTFAQTDTTITRKADTASPLKVAIIAPIYLDSVFVDNEYMGGNTLPAYMLPGLDFYNGAMMAVDSLQKENVPVEVWVFDAKKKFESTDMLKVDLETENFNLIIAYVSNAMEQKELGDFAFKHNIPFISGTYPNDAGLSANPYFAIVNPTLKTHVQAIYRYVQRNYLANNVYYVTKQGGMEQRIKSYFEAMKNTGVPLKYTTIVLPPTFTASDVTRQMDTTEEGVIVCGSLDEAFGTKLIRTINSSSAAKMLTVVGMPTWDAMGCLYSEDCKNVNVVFSTPYNYNRKNALEASLSNRYRAKFGGRPSDMVFKGFEQVYHFTHLLVQHRDSLFTHLSDPAYKISNDYNFQPVRLTSSSYAPDFLENKKLYFIKMLGGSVKAVN